MISKPKYKIARRLGAGVFDKTQTAKFAASAARKSKGGAFGKRPKALSEYGQQLVEKQKTRFSYGISERQLSNYVAKVTQTKGAGTTDKLYERLESRLDNAVYRLGLSPSRRGARQMVSHGHFTVNGTRVTIPSYELKVGDIIKIREGSKGKTIFSGMSEKLKEYRAPEWLSLDVGTLEGKVLGKPKNSDSFLDLNAVLEFYSR